MYDMGTVAQEYEILTAFDLMSLQVIVNNRLREDWRLHGPMMIQQTISGSPNAATTTYYSGTIGHSPISVSAPAGGGGTIVTTMFQFIQVVIR